MPTPIKTPREILMEIRQYEMDCGCVDENCPSCAKRIDQALQALDAYYKARDNKPNIVRKQVNGKYVELYIDNEDVLKSIQQDLKARVRVDDGEIRNLLLVLKDDKGNDPFIRYQDGQASKGWLRSLIARTISSHSTQIIKIEGER